MNEKLIEYAMQSIRQTLTTRPDTADTLEGIHEWWIQWSEPHPNQEVTLTALERLEKLGVMESLTQGKRKLWRRKR